MDEMWERLEARYHDAVFLRDRISTARRDHQAGTAELSSSDKVRLDRASDRVVRPLEEALKMLTLATPDTRDGVFGKSRWLAAGRFMVRKAQLIDMTERTEKALAELRDVASEVLYVHIYLCHILAVYRLTIPQRNSGFNGDKHQVDAPQDVGNATTAS